MDPLGSESKGFLNNVRKRMTSTLGLFNNKLINFFDDLANSYPEERDIKMALEALNGARKVNPRLIVDMFIEYVSKPLKDYILTENEEKVIAFAKASISVQFNEISPALMIFDKHWPDMTDSNRKAIWNHLKVLVLLADKVQR